MHFPDIPYHRRRSRKPKHVDTLQISSNSNSFITSEHIGDSIVRFENVSTENIDTSSNHLPVQSDDEVIPMSIEDEEQSNIVTVCDSTFILGHNSFPDNGHTVSNDAFLSGHVQNAAESVLGQNVDENCVDFTDNSIRGLRQDENRSFEKRIKVLEAKNNRLKNDIILLKRSYEECRLSSEIEVKKLEKKNKSLQFTVKRHEAKIRALQRLHHRERFSFQRLALNKQLLQHYTGVSATVVEVFSEIFNKWNIDALEKVCFQIL
jgi:hypothetical protein